jgi:DNA-binding MarR family transcriptional regulator
MLRSETIQTRDPLDRAVLLSNGAIRRDELEDLCSLGGDPYLVGCLALAALDDSDTPSLAALDDSDIPPLCTAESSAPLGLVKEQCLILRALQQAAPQTLSQEALAGATHLSEKTARRWLQILEKAGLVQRPHGQRKGYTITPDGGALLARVGT